MKDPSIPQFVVNPEVKITLDIPPTDAQVEDQGYTYNQAGFTYNQPGMFYGGVYQTNQDIAPVFFNDTATLLNPSINGIIDIQGIKSNTNSGQLMGILGLTYP